MPSEKYAHGPEIREHCRRIGKQFDLYDNALFHTQVTDLEWDGGRSRWIVRTNRGDEFTAQFVAMGTGPLHVPKLPGIAGIETFQGHSFHTSRWDYGYTGGDPEGADGPAGGQAGRHHRHRRATSVQCVPHLATACKELYVFQRTPSSVDVRDNRPTDPSGSPRWPPPAGSSAGSNFTANQAGGTAEEDLVMDGWTDLARRVRARAMTLPPEDSARRRDGRLRGLRLREDGGDPAPDRHDRRGPRHGLPVEGVVPAAVQATVLPRRVPPGVQHARHAPRRHRRQGRRAHHRHRRGGGRGRVRGRLHHLRIGLRGRHPAHAAGRVST